MPNLQEEWQSYLEHELARVKTELAHLGYLLDVEQQHLVGERYLLLHTHDVGGGGKKLILTGKDSANRRVVIKASSDPAGIREIERERTARATMAKLDFSHHLLTPPHEFLYQNKDGLVLSSVEYIEQDMPFIERRIERQFMLGLKALKIQEGVHATTYGHSQVIESVFGAMYAADYLAQAAKYAVKLGDLGTRALSILKDGEWTIEQYCNFLTHADFVPHNLRIRNNEIYLLDYASIHFGNKHESWARFLNFMLLYNRPLEAAFLQYLADNRTPEERVSLRLMRIYKILFLVYYHSSNLASTTGDLHTLTESRVVFWTKVLESLVNDQPLSDQVIDEYKKLRDSLRDEGELMRQKNLH